MLHLPTPQQLREQNEQQAWQTRQQIHRDADRLLPPLQARDAKNIVDRAIEAVFPGIIARHESPQTPPPAPAQTPAPDSSPCPPEAKACVDVDHQVSWLQDGHGHRVGPIVAVSTGATKFDTPAGRHIVNRKVKAEVSFEFGNALMPNAVYFTNTGIAFHAGDPNILSHGCVHLTYGDSERYFNYLNPGDLVYVWGAVNYGVPNGPVHR